jgi:hypothetical protein
MLAEDEGALLRCWECDERVGLVELMGVTVAPEPIGAEEGLESRFLRLSRPSCACEASGCGCGAKGLDAPVAAGPLAELAAPPLPLLAAATLRRSLS